jgi:hypothetical protein
MKEPPHMRSMSHGAGEVDLRYGAKSYGMKVKSMQNLKHTIKDLNNALVMIQKGWPLQPGGGLCNAILIFLSQSSVVSTHVTRAI